MKMRIMKEYLKHADHLEKRAYYIDLWLCPEDEDEGWADMYDRLYANGYEEAVDTYRRAVMDAANDVENGMYASVVVMLTEAKGSGYPMLAEKITA